MNEKQYEDIVIGAVNKVMQEKSTGINAPIRATIASIDSTYRCSVNLLDDINTRTNIVIPYHLAGTLSVGNTVFLIEMGSATDMMVLARTN